MELVVGILGVILYETLVKSKMSKTKSGAQASPQIERDWALVPTRSYFFLQH